MMPSILGMGWVTPLGRSLPDVLQAILDRRVPAPRALQNPFSQESFSVLHVPPESIADATSVPRLRRSSEISHFALAAACDAFASSGLPPEALTRTALVFAASDGGVVYTRRFYADIVERGPGAGSPLLFPETVYNAPASHIAARLGIESTALSLVGDAATAFSAIHTAAELMETDEADYCLVVGSQELDWITCDAYVRWSPSGRTFYSDGAAAMLLGKSDSKYPTLRTHLGATFTTKRDAALRLGNICDELLSHAPSPQLIVNSASATPLDEVERSVLAARLPNARLIEPKLILGESHCVSTLQQIIVAALVTGTPENDRALVSAIGFNGQISALVLTAGNLQA